MPKFTASQQEAIDARNHNILVSAAAGSGKTAVLVERIIKLITDRDNPVNINELLVVTFTDAAAGEMRERISKALSERIKNEPTNTHLKNQLTLMPAAQISTLHSFCASVVRNNFVAAGVDPQFRVGENTEIGILKESILDELFNKEYELKENSFYRLLDIFSDRFYDTGLRELVLRIYEFSQSFLEPQKWLLDSAENFAPLNELEDNIWSKPAVEEIKIQIKSAIESCYNALRFCDMENGPTKYKDAFLADIEMLEDIYSVCDFGLKRIDKAVQRVSFQKLASVTAKDNVNPYLKELANTIRKNVKANIANIQEKYFFKPLEDMTKDSYELYPILKKLTDMAIEFSENYLAEKMDNNLLDFSDLEHFTYKILKENDDIADYYRQLFFEIYTDEYQDSNIIQEEILNLIAKKNNRFMVGDVKQSIYKFRRANPDIFIDKYNSYKDMENCLRVDLSTNFRSRENVLASANFLFKQLMSKESSSIHYGKDEMLYYGAPYPEDNGTMDDTTELIIIETKNPDKDDLSEDIANFSNAEKEAMAIAARIKKLTNGEEPQLVYDKNTETYRKAEYGDITILLRSLTAASTFVHTLSKEGIPVHANTSGGYFGNIEVLVMLNLLRAIDNPLQDISILSVLHSPLYDFSADDLAKIRKISPTGDYYNAVVNFVNCEDENIKDSKLFNAAHKFLEDLNRWRKLKSQLSVSKLISTLFDETGYFDYVCLLPDALIKQANLMALFEHAIQFENTSLQGIFKFIRYIEKLIERDSDVKDAQVVSEKGNIVQVMTIHKSKGLEFPICIVADLGKRINRRDEYASLVLHQDYGFGPVYISTEPKIRSSTLAKSVLAGKLHKENYSEELRILYVALTRAKDKLILTGCVSDCEKSLIEWAKTISCASEKLPAHYIFDPNTYLSWIGACIARHNCFRDKLMFDAPPCDSSVYTDPSRWSIAVVEGSEYTVPNETEYREENNILPDNLAEFDYGKYQFFHEKISKNFLWEYENLQYTTMPAKISISEIKRNYFSQMKIDAQNTGDSNTYVEPTFDIPAFLDKDRKLTGAEKGTAMHTVMEHLDIKSVETREAIVNLVEFLRQGNLLNQKQADSINIDKIFSLVSSNLGNRMRNAEKLEKEVAFVLEIDAADSYLPDAHEGTLLVHGIIDCYFVEGGRIVLVDYKSDYVGESDLEKVKERYKIQLDIYKQALESSLDLEVGEVLLYLFDIDRYVSMFD